MNDLMKAVGIVGAGIGLGSALMLASPFSGAVVVVDNCPTPPPSHPKIISLVEYLPKRFKPKCKNKYAKI